MYDLVVNVLVSEIVRFYVFSWFVTDSLPVGYTADAKNHSEVRHKIPYAGLENGIRDFRLVLNEVYALVETKNGGHTAYCLSEEYKQIDSGLKYLNNNGKVS